MDFRHCQDHTPERRLDKANLAGERGLRPDLLSHKIVTILFLFQFLIKTCADQAHASGSFPSAAKKGV